MEVAKRELHQKELEHIISNMFNMTYNGQMLESHAVAQELGPDINLQPNVRRLQEEKDNNVSTIVWRNLEPRLVENKYVELGYNYRYFESPVALQMVWLVEKGGNHFFIEILIRWDCANQYIVEYNVEYMHEDKIVTWALEGLLEYMCKFNFSKIENRFSYVYTNNSRIPVLFTNEITKIKSKEKEDEIS